MLRALHRCRTAAAVFTPSCALALLGAASAHAAEPAHSHGHARLDIAVEANRIHIAFKSPLDNLLGFERAPRTDAERKQADALVAQLNAAQSLFKVDPAAQCQLGKVELASAALKLGPPRDKSQQAGHADIDGHFEFNCADAMKATYLEHGLFQFARLKRLDVQLATPKGQSKRSLKPPTQRIELVGR